MIALLGLLACGTLSDQAAAAVTAVNPLAGIDRDLDRSAFSGVVDEVVPAGGYTYLHVGERWVVGLDHGFGVGAEVVVRPLGLARDFHSARTGRTFDEVWFAVVATP